MKAVLQRARGAKVTVNGEIVASIAKGLVILLGVGPDDDPQKARELAEKCARLRIFEDDQDKMNLSLLDVAGEAIVVSQFTLYADTSRGRRPSFVGAAKPDLAEPLVDIFAASCASWGSPPARRFRGAYAGGTL